MITHEVYNYEYLVLFLTITRSESLSQTNSSLYNEFTVDDIHSMHLIYVKYALYIQIIKKVFEI